MEWPKPGDQLFKSDIDWQFNACISSYSPSLSRVAFSYKSGADALAIATMKGECLLDCGILPIVFLYRQFLELTLKDIIDTARQVEGEGPGYPKTHDLKALWTETTRLVHKHYDGNVPTELPFVDPIIDEFSQHDPESMAFRYPTDRKGNVSLQGLKHVNLRNLYETMERVGSMLECLAADISAKLDSIHDMQSEWGP